MYLLFRDQIIEFQISSTTLIQLVAAVLNIVSTHKQCKCEKNTYFSFKNHSQHIPEQTLYFP